MAPRQGLFAFAVLAAISVPTLAQEPRAGDAGGDASPQSTPAPDCSDFRQKWTGPNAKGNADSLYRSLMVGAMQGVFGEDPSGWPVLYFLTDDEMTQFGGMSPDVLGTALPPWTGANNTDRPVIIVSQRVVGIACSSKQMMFVFAHEIEHHKPRPAIQGRSHLQYIKDKKQAMFQDWLVGAGNWWMENKGKDDPYIADWLKQHKNDRPPRPFSDEIIRQKLFDAAMADKGPIWSAAQRKMEQEADAEAIEAVAGYYENKLHQDFDRKELSAFFSRMFEFEKSTNDPPQPFATHDPADQRAIQALDQTMLDKVLADQQRNQ